MDNFTSDRKESCFVEFYKDSVHSQYQSEAAGHPVFVDCDMIRIRTPGDTKTEIDTKVEESHKIRFARQWENYKRGEQQGIVGWKLEEWPAIASSQVKLLKYNNVHTVEQLAAVADVHLANLGLGIMDLRAKARASLAAAAGNADNEKQAVENKRLQEEIDSLKALLKQPVTAAEDATRQRGRPPKE